MSILTMVVARTGHIDEMRDRTVSGIVGAEILEASTEEDAIRIAVDKFNKTADQIRTINPDYKINPARVGALEMWSEDDLIGWEIDSEFYEVTDPKA